MIGKEKSSARPRSWASINRLSFGNGDLFFDHATALGRPGKSGAEETNGTDISDVLGSTQLIF